MNHQGGHDHSRDGRRRRCDACTRLYSWAELRECYSPRTDDDGFWLCQPCLARIPAVVQVPLLPRHDAKSTNLWAVLERAAQERGEA